MHQITRDEVLNQLKSLILRNNLLSGTDHNGNLKSLDIETRFVEIADATHTKTATAFILTTRNKFGLSPSEEIFHILENAIEEYNMW